jgi:hypothetical protein
LSVQADRLSEALDDLDPGDRALLELSLQRGISDERLAPMLGNDPGDVADERRRVLQEIGAKLDLYSREELDEIADAIRDLGTSNEEPGEDDDRLEREAAAKLHGGESVTERDEEASVGFLRSNSLAIFFLVIFLAALGAQSYAGWRNYNHEQHANEQSGVSYVRYLSTSDFANAVTENWQSEYLQFVLYFMATIWFVQRGSPESKKWRDRGRQSDEDQEVGDHARPDSPAPARGDPSFFRAVYSNSLLLVMGAFWIGSWFAQSVTGWSAYNSNQIEQGERTVNWVGYIGTSDFWQATLQNWQSEFLAVGSMAIFAVYLRQRGSPESKPVGAPHDETASTG